MSDDTSIYGVNDSGEACMRVSENVTSNDPTSIYGVNEDGKASVRVMGISGGGGGSVTSVNGKTGVVVLTSSDLTTSVTVSATTLTQELANDTIYDCGELTALTITLPATINADWVCQLNFTSGTTPTSLTAPNTIKWKGDDLTDGVFVPVASKRYAVLFFTDGVNVRGIVQAVA